MQHAPIKHIGIIGGGQFGQALERSLHRAGIRVEFYDQKTDRSTVASIEELVKHNQVLLLCSPSWANRGITEEIALHAKQGSQHVVLCFSKGVETGFVTMDQILEASLGEAHVYGLAYGPMLAEELAVGRQGAAVLSLSDMSWYDRLSELLLKAKISCEPSSDLQGLAVAAVLKNIYAIAFGMSDGLHLGKNVKGKLAVVVLREMRQILIHFEADPVLAEGLAALGDLVTTGISDASFNYSVGKSIAQGIADNRIRSEGLHTLKELNHKLTIDQYPLLNALNRIIYHHEPVELLEQLLLGPVQH